MFLAPRDPNSLDGTLTELLPGRYLPLLKLWLRPSLPSHEGYATPFGNAVPSMPRTVTSLTSRHPHHRYTWDCASRLAKAHRLNLLSCRPPSSSTNCGPRDISQSPTPCKKKLEEIDMHTRVLPFLIASALPILALAQSVSVAQGSAVPPMAEQVRSEALKSNNDPDGRPLPVVSVWHPFMSCYKFNPSQWQLTLLEQGYPIMPWINAYMTHTQQTVEAEYASFLTTLKAWKMPVTFMYGTQWEDAWKSTHYDYAAGPITATGLGMNLDGTRMSELSPLSPAEAWYNLGRDVAQGAGVQTYEKFYPDPPLVLFVSNNESARLPWSKANSEKRYVDTYGTETTDNFKRDVWFDGWVARYRALFDGMRQNLAETSWRQAIRFHGYNAFAPDHFGRWGAWQGQYEGTQDRLAWQPYAWDGGIPESYDNDWESQKTVFRLWSVQTEMMNMEFAKDEAWAINPEMWYSTIFWDGLLWQRDSSKATQYDNNTEGYTPELYGGWIKYVTWLNVPRQLWHYQDYVQGDPNGDGLCSGSDVVKGEASLDFWYPYFEPLLDLAKEIYDDPLLQRFWRKGELVRNADMLHPFNFEIPSKWAGTERWYHLSTNYDPIFPVHEQFGAIDLTIFNPTMPVYTLARVLGEAPNREWLVYAHAPTGAVEGVLIKIPGHCTIDMGSVAIEGTFKHVVEGDGSCVDAVGSPGLRLYYSFDEVDLDNEDQEITDGSGNNFHGDWLSPLGSIVPGIKGKAILTTNPGGGDVSDNIVVGRDVRNPFNLEELMRSGGSISYWIKAVPLETNAGVGEVVRTTGGPNGFAAVHNRNLHNTLNVVNNGALEPMRGTYLGEDGGWHMITHVISSDKIWSYYYDGDLEKTGGPVSEFPSADRHGIRIAVGPNAPVDEIRLYDYALTAADVESLYRETLAPPRIDAPTALRVTGDEAGAN